MSDIVERLKTPRCWMRHQGMAIVTDDAPFEAADEIERLREQIENVRAINDGNMEVSEMFRHQRDDARARLAEAVEVIERLANGGIVFMGQYRAEAHAFLAKLEGRSGE